VKKNTALRYYLAGAAALATFVVYLAALQNDFVNWDDDHYVIKNLAIRSFDGPFFRWAFLDFYESNWHPLTWISHAADYAIWGLNPLGHHLTNIVLHAVNTVIVVLLIIRLLEVFTARTVQSGGSPFLNERTIPIAAGVTGLLFGLHPIHVESVAWVAERKDLLCALFFLISITLYVRHVSSTNNESDKKNRVSRFFSKSLLLSLGFFILALLSKPMAVTLPVVLLILDWYPFNRIRSLKTLGAAGFEKLPFIALSFFSSIVTIRAQSSVNAIWEALPLSGRLVVASKSLVAYLWKMMLPLELIPFYPYPQKISFFSLEYLATVALVVGITIACVVIGKKQKFWLSTWGYYVVTLIPVLGIVQVGGQLMADRYTYLPSLGPFLVLGLGAAWITEKVNTLKSWGPVIKALGAAGLFVIFISLSYLTFQQVGIWKNSIDLWTYVITREPSGAPVAYYNRGKAYMEMGRFDKAAEDFDATIAVDPQYYEAYNNRGILYERAGLFDKAIELFNRAIIIDPLNYIAYTSRGYSYADLGQYDRAIEDFNTAIRLNQNSDRTFLWRAYLYLRIGKRELAVADFRRACDLGNEDGCNALR
jgi:tetratricopeptide (TPR) repeat protein